MKRMIALVSIFLLAFTSLFSSVSFAETSSNGVNGLDPNQTFDKLAPKKSVDPVGNLLDEDDDVRVIVEVEGETPIEYATKKKVMYKDLQESTKQALEQEAREKQTEVQNHIDEEKVALQVEETFTTVVNGFSGTIKVRDIARIKSLPNVEDVYISTKYNRPEPQPNMTTSHDFIQSRQTWEEAEYQGEGTVISVIDSGVDPDHKDFKITDSSLADLNKSKVNSIISENDLLGQYYNEKVPYGYNYYDKNSEIMDIGPEASEHGMHVAGTTAANGEIRGVAPEAQVLGMKVFSNDPEYPSTWEDIYLKAIDDSIKLGADVINMSLGSTAAFYEAENVADKAITKAVENGIVVSVSAGNSGHIGYGYDNPLANNPDIGVVGAPGLSKNSLQVAATGNVTYLYETSFDVGDVSVIGYGADDWEAAFSQDDLPIVSLDGGVGNPEDYEGVDVEGKVVLVKRGEISFYDKSLHAKAAGAVGIMVYDHGLSMFYKDQGGWGVIPFAMISKDDGAALEQAIDDGATDVSFNLEEASYGPEVGKMTDFTSWGTTPSLELKPEISAPGGNIYSTMNNDQYGVKSGTSMAAPHVAGGAALVNQYLKKEFPELDNGERSRFAKVLLMNTASVIYDDNDNAFSPRRQGAGMMQTFAAVRTPVTIVEPSSDEAKVELKDFDTEKVSFSLEATNHSDEGVLYGIDTSVLTDTEEDGINQLTAGNTGAEVTVTGDVYGEPVTVTNAVYGEEPKTLRDGVYIEGNSTAKVTIEIDLSDAQMPGTSKDLIKNNFVEGFVSFISESAPTLSIPYVGFYGEWDEPRIFDGNTDFDETSFYEYQGMLDQDLGFLSVNDEGAYAISPNGDGRSDEIIPLPTFLRNARVVEFNILNESEDELRTILEERFVRKNFFDAGNGTRYSFNPARAWDGTVKFESVEDGLYYYEMKAKVDYDGADWQTIQRPVYVDTVAPELSVSFDDETKTVSWTAQEDGSGVLGFDVLVDGESVLEDLLSAESMEYTFEEELDGANVVIAAVDYAQNLGYASLYPFDDESPVIRFTSPEALTPYNTSEIVVEGTIEEDTPIYDFTVNGKAVEVSEDAGTGEKSFRTTVTYEEDGTKEIAVSATDANGNKLGITRTIFVDTTKGTITLNGNVPSYVGSDDSSYELDVTLEDNYRSMEYYVDDNFKYGFDFDTPYVMDGHKADVTTQLDLKEGTNTFKLRLVDLGGNETVKDITIHKLAEGEEPPTAQITSLETSMKKRVSLNRPVTISAASSETISWDVTVFDPSENQVAQFNEQTGEEFVAVFQPGERAQNGEYTIIATGKDSGGQPVQDVKTTFNVYNYSALIKNVTTLNGNGENQSSFESDDRAQVKAEIENLEDFSLSPLLIVQVVDEDRRVVESSFMNMNELYSKGSNGIGFEVDVNDLAPGTYTVEAYVWEGWEQGVLAEPNKSEVKFEIE